MRKSLKINDSLVCQGKSERVDTIRTERLEGLQRGTRALEVTGALPKTGRIAGQIPPAASSDFPALLTRLGAASTAWQVIGGRLAGGVWEVSAR